jgi:hypothetical protein
MIIKEANMKSLFIGSCIMFLLIISTTAGCVTNPGTPGNLQSPTPPPSIGTPVLSTTVLLPAASPGVHYDSSLQIANATIPNGQWQLVSTSGQLPPGLSVVHIEHGCVPTEPACLQNNFDLSGTPTQAGTYTFSVTFSMGGDLITQAYQVRILP